jgi:hypothetical protein
MVFETAMLSWLIGKKDQAKRGEDSVWMSGAARLKGIRGVAERFVKDGHSVVVVALTLPDFDDLVRELDQYKPLPCRDLFGLDSLRRQLARAGSVAVSLANVLSTDVKPVTTVPVEILVCGRNFLRAADESILRFADLIGTNAQVAFHLSLDDEVLKDYVGSLKQVLGRLGLSENEAISSPMVTRAVARALSRKRS